MTKQKSYYSLFEQLKPHEEQIYEARDYQTQILDSLNYMARDYDDENDLDEDNEEDFFDDEDGIEGTVTEEEKESYMYVFDRTQRWKTKIFREYFQRAMSLAI